MMYLRDDEVLYDSTKASEVKNGLAPRRRGQSTESVAVATPREALQEFPRRVDALVQSIVIHAAGEHVLLYVRMNEDAQKMCVMHFFYEWMYVCTCIRVRI